MYSLCNSNRRNFSQIRSKVATYYGATFFACPLRAAWKKEKNLAFFCFGKPFTKIQL